MKKLSPYTSRALKHLNRFNPLVDSSPVWLNAFEYLVVYFGLKEEEKTPFFLDMIQRRAYRNVEVDCEGCDPVDLPYSELLAKFCLFYSWRRGRSLAMYRFFNRVQMPYETVTQYADALKILIVKCRFRHQEKKALFKKFSIGVRNLKTRDKIKQLEIKDKSEKEYEELFERSFVIALEIECEEKLEREETQNSEEAEESGDPRESSGSEDSEPEVRCMWD